MRHSRTLLLDRKVPLTKRLDGLLLLGVYLISPMLMLGWLLSLLLYFTVTLQVSAPAVLLIAFMGHSALGNFAAFFEIAAAAHLDRSHRRVRLIAFNWLGFIVSAVAIAHAVLEQALLDRWSSRSFHWDKTVRYRRVPSGPAA